ESMSCACLLMYEARTTGKAVGSSSAGADGRGWGQMTERALIGGAPMRAVASASRAPFGEGATTSLGRALSGALALPHHDTDDYLWRPTTPPYRELRAVEDRLRLMSEMFLPRTDWVLSGGLDGWGDGLVPNFDLVVFLKTPREIQMQRLRAREA